MFSDRDPIAAIATAPGRGGIGVVRVSGADLAPVIEGLLGAERAARLAPRHATFAPFLDAEGTAIDEGIALLFPSPHSYTGETVLELQGHGGPVVLQMLLARCLEAGRPIGRPASRQRASSICSTTGPPWPCSSSTVSPVYERGAGNSSAMPSSIVRPCASRNGAKAACRGASLAARSAPSTPSITGQRSTPETRTTPMPPRPGAVAIAAIGSRSENTEKR